MPRSVSTNEAMPFSMRTPEPQVVTPQNSALPALAVKAPQASPTASMAQSSASPERSHQRSQTERSQRKWAVVRPSFIKSRAFSTISASAWARSPKAATSVPRAAKVAPFSKSTTDRPFSLADAAAATPDMPAPQTATSQETVSTTSSSAMGSAM